MAWMQRPKVSKEEAEKDEWQIELLKAIAEELKAEHRLERAVFNMPFRR